MTLLLLKILSFLKALKYLIKMKREQLLVLQLEEVQSELQANADYKEKEYALDVIRAYAKWYENYPPTEDLNFPFQFKASQVGNDPYMQRLANAFTAAGKVITYVFV